jgi:hypothetical protein
MGELQEVAWEFRKRKAMRHSNKLGAGAKKRKKLLSPEEKEKVVMAEWERGTLHSGSGQIVPENRPDWAYAIAKSVAKKRRKLRHG